jgi:hypothetical protein
MDTLPPNHNQLGKEALQKLLDVSVLLHGLGAVRLWHPLRPGALQINGPAAHLGRASSEDLERLGQGTH